MKLFMNGLIFESLSGCNSIFSWFNAVVAEHWKHLLSWLFGIIAAFFFFIQSGESIYDPPNLNLSYDISNATVELNRKQNYSFSLIFINYVGILKEVTQNVCQQIHLHHHKA